MRHVTTILYVDFRQVNNKYYTRSCEVALLVTATMNPDVASKKRKLQALLAAGNPQAHVSVHVSSPQHIGHRTYPVSPEQAECGGFFREDVIAAARKPGQRDDGEQTGAGMNYSIPCMCLQCLLWREACELWCTRQEAGGHSEHLPAALPARQTSSSFRLDIIICFCL